MTSRARSQHKEMEGLEIGDLHDQNLVYLLENWDLD
jgi:hypothetical protein